MKSPEDLFISEEAAVNFETFKRNNYPGRVFVVGRNDNGDFTVFYALTGRSEGSKNRKLEKRSGRVSVVPADPSKTVGDPSLTLYDAIVPLGYGLIVSNGSQGEVARLALDEGQDFSSALSTQKYEPDSPLFTSRISGLITSSGIDVSRIRKSADSEDAVHDYFEQDLPKPGYGYMMHTYNGQDQEGVKRFMGDPYVVPLAGSPDQILDTYWNALPQEYRVSAVVGVKSSGTDYYIRNIHA